MTVRKRASLLVVAASLLLTACSASLESKKMSAEDSLIQVMAPELASDTSLIWAVNVGGGQYRGVDGVSYDADSGNTDGITGRIDSIEGTQDKTLYETYKMGDLTYAKAVPNGHYELTFKFAEPATTPDRRRLFSVFAEDKQVISDLDVTESREARVYSALAKTVIGVEVTDGELNIQLRGHEGTGLLNGFLVRQKQPWDTTRKLLWHDEFDGRGLATVEAPDPALWTVDVWRAHKVNDENQAYTNRSKNIRVEGGYLVSEAHKEDYQNGAYTSGRVHSASKGSLLYGRVEVRARLPKGRGSWSAIWMLPEDPFKYASNCQTGDAWQGSENCDAWPNSGEIDIMEHVANDMDNVHGTVHNRGYYGINFEQRKGSINVEGAGEEFHVYAVDWTPNALRFYVDGSLYFTYKNEGDGWLAWPYDHPYHVILNLAVGGIWGRAGGPIDNSAFPQRMEIDYVRAYGP